MVVRERGIQAPNDVPPPAGILLTVDLRRRIIEHLTSTAPLEGVGLLGVGATERADLVRATRFYPGTNVDASPTRYTMNPAEVIAALHDIEANGWWLGAIVHSHPSSPAVPSRTDFREAHYPDALMIIASLTCVPPEVRAWRIASGPVSAGGPFVEVPILLDAFGNEGRPQPRAEVSQGKRR